jgi:hypothetical protein
MTDTERPRDDEVITSEMAELWQNERVRISEEIAQILAKTNRLQARLVHINGLLKAAAALRPEIQDWLDSEEEKAMGEEAVVLTTAIKRFLTANKGKPSQREAIKTGLPQHGYPAIKLQANPNYFYTALKRLVKREEILEAPSGAFSLKEN